jgi:hypothetical protein
VVSLASTSAWWFEITLFLESNKRQTDKLFVLCAGRRSIKLPAQFLSKWLYYSIHKFTVPEEQEIIELVPNIILNPGFEGNVQNEQLPADENSNNETPLRLNNNTVVQPRNV